MKIQKPTKEGWKMFNYVQGNDVLLYIRTAEGFKAVSCLIDNPLQESTEVIETTSRGSGRFRSYIGGVQDYTISFTAHMVNELGLVSYEHIKQLKRNIIIFDWRLMATDGVIAETGTSFISSLSLNSSVNSLVEFSATLTPSVGGVSDILLWSQDGFNVVSQNGENLVQIK